MPKGKGKKWKKNGYDPQQDDGGYGNFHVDEPNLRGYEYNTTGASSPSEIYGTGDNSYSRYNSASSSGGYGAYSGGYGGGGGGGYNSNRYASGGYGGGGGGGYNSNSYASGGYGGGGGSGYNSNSYASGGYGGGGNSNYSSGGNSYNPTTYAGYSSADYDYEESDDASRYYETDKTADEVYAIMGENPNTGYVQKPYLGESRLYAKSRSKKNGKYGSNYGGKSRKQKKTLKKNKKLRKTRRRT
jgi:hypothetical protein